MMRDTLPGAQRTRLKALAAMSPADRLREALEMSDIVMDLARKGQADREALAGAESAVEDHRLK